MKIFVVNAYVRENGGDASLVSVMLKQVKQAFPKADIALNSMEDPRKFHTFEGVTNKGAIIRYTSEESINPIRRVLRKLLCIFIGEVWFIGPKGLYKMLNELLPWEVRVELQTLMSSDVVVSLGGGYINGKNTIGWDLNVFFRLMPLKLGKRLGKVVILGPQSYGPYGNKRQERWVRAMFNTADLVMVREQPSIDLLTRIGVDPSRLLKTVDSGFAFEVPAQPDVFKPFNLKKGAPVLGITARQWLPAKQQTIYEKSLAKVIDFAQQKYGMNVVLIPQVTSRFRADDDRIVEKRIADFCAIRPIVVDEHVDHLTLKAMYGKLDYLIGTRFHSVIFGVTSYVPCIAIEYEHKTGGIMHDLDLDKWVIKIEAVTAPKLKTLLEQLVAERKSYLTHLKKVLPPYVQQAKDVPSIIRRVVNERAAAVATPKRDQ
ncbi:MAG TPA: polysaccharide pyruvyl transferase family protein [Candidatus Saccharimonas sp.]|nr:polysaccharide pyruvyl transferase family protein [Candidatus Saccharimonas sp.]